MNEPILTLQGVTVTAGSRAIARNVSFSLQPGEFLVIAGQSGSGKSTILKAIGGLLEQGASVTNGTITALGRTIHKPADLKPLRGTGISVAFQDALSSFCPVHSIEKQLVDAARFCKCFDADFRKRAEKAAASLGLPPQSLQSHPQELSGGMVQRAELLFPLLIPPRILLADEPTSAVDSITQKKMADAMLALRQNHDTAVILVTHDLRLAAYVADTLLVLKNGRIQEYGPAADIIRQPQSPYTRELLTHSGLIGESAVPLSSSSVDVSNSRVHPGKGGENHAS